VAPQRPIIEFLCRPDDRGVIAEPVPARSALPEWFRHLKGVDTTQLTTSNNGITVKRCMPFLDALSLAWILPLAATVRLQISDGGRTVDSGWDFDREMVSNHGGFQVAGNPFEPRPPMKFHNYWTIRTAPGWSCLLLPPINRPDPVVHILSGVVDTDTYASPVNSPFFAVARDGMYTLRKGTPLAHVVPFRRKDVVARGVVRSETPDEAEARERIRRNTAAGDGWYRNHARAPH
jgi:hypothetical protein